MSGVDVLAVMDREIEEARKRIPVLPPEGPIDAEQQTAYEEAGSAFVALREARAAVAALIERDRIRSIELACERNKTDRLVRIMAAIKIRCAPDDIATQDGKLMRFVPPDPEMYWRELSNNVRSAMEEMREIFTAEDASGISRVRGAE